MRSRILCLLCGLLAVFFFFAVVYAIQNESLGEVWPTIWGSLWGQLMLLDLYLGFIVITILMRELCQWSLFSSIIFLLLCCVLGNGVSLLALAVLLYRKVYD